MGFFDIFKRKKQITPAMLREMMEDLREEVKQALAIEDVEQREKAIKASLERVEEISVIVDETLEKVESYIEDLSSRDWWASQEAVNSDLRGLTSGRNTLLARKEELAKMNSELSVLIGANEQTQSEPGAE